MPCTKCETKVGGSLLDRVSHAGSLVPAWGNSAEPLGVRTSGDTETSVEVVEYGKESRGGLQGSEVGTDETQDGHANDEVGVQPVDMLVPVAPGDGGLGDVRLLHIVAGLAQRLVVGGPVWEDLSDV